MSRRLPLGLLVLLTLAAPGPAASASGATGGRPRACGVAAPHHVRLEHRAGTRTGRLTWRARRVPGRQKVSYRVLRDGVVVGQTRGRSMRVAIVPGRRYVFQVRLVRRGIPLRTCTARRVAWVALRAPGAVGALRIEDLTNHAVTLAWSPAAAGDAPVAGYRVIRDDKTYKQIPGTEITVPLATRREYSFTVAAVDTRGTLGPPAGRIRVRTGFAGPGPVADLTVTATSDTSATLTWSAAPAGDAPVAGYRITRDDRTWRQVPTTSATVPLASAREYTFSVAAVDSHGELGTSSQSVRVATGHSAPGAPDRLAAADVTDSGVVLTWAPAQASSGRIVGYRVFRDGVLVGQFPGTSATLPNLPAASDMSFTVAAVDSFGYLGPATPPLPVHTADPDPTRGRLQAFLLATTDESFRDLQAHYRQIGTVYPTYYECASDTSISGDDDPLVSNWARLRKVAVMPRLDCQRTAAVHAILTDPARRSAVIAGLTALAAEHGYDGINLDFEAGAAEDRDALSSFVADLAAALHAQGDRLAVEVSPKSWNTTTGRSGFYDYRALAAVADTVVVMNWGLHWTTSIPGPLSDIGWATKNLDYVASMPDPSKFVIGFPLYGIDWAAGGGRSHPGVPLQHADIQSLAASVGANPELDAVAQERRFTYTDAGGTGHEVWFMDADAIAARVRAAADRGLNVAFWRLGSEDQRMWDDPLLAAAG